MTEKFNSVYNSIILEASFLEPQLPKGRKSYNKTARKGTNTAFTFKEVKFTTEKGNIVKVQFIPDIDGVELAFTVNDSYDDKASGKNRDSEIIPGVLGIIKKEVDKNKWKELTILPKSSDKDFKIKRNENLKGAKENLLKVIDKIKKFKKETESEKWLNHLLHDESIEKILSGEWDSVGIADSLYLYARDSKGNSEKLEKDFKDALTDYGTAIKTEKDGGRKIKYNRRNAVFKPLLKKLLPDYNMKESSSGAMYLNRK